MAERVSPHSAPTPVADRRYQIQPLISAMGLSQDAAMRKLRISGNQYQQYRDLGMRRAVADRQAVKAGFHPYEVWPEMADHDIADIERVCAADGCDERFLPPQFGGNKKHPARFCSERCRKREKMRRYRQRNPETRVKAAEYARQYRSEVAEAKARRAAMRLVPGTYIELTAEKRKEVA